MTHKELHGFIGLGAILAVLLAVILAKQCTNKHTETRLQEAIRIAQEADSIADISEARADSASVEAAFGSAGPEGGMTSQTGRTRKPRPSKQGTKRPTGRNALPADMSSPHDRPVESGR